jgi:rhamnosyltransferase
MRVIVPTRNGGSRWEEAARALASAVERSSQVVVIDSESSDNSVAIAKDLGFVVREIPVTTFNHGRTRQLALEEFAADCEYAVFLTQDAILDTPMSIHALLESFDDSRVAAAFGRQIPHHEAGYLARHAALFNYPETSGLRTLADAPKLGIKTAYFSNSFAAYRVDALNAHGGFPCDLILGEDVYVAAMLLMAGHVIRYSAEAAVRHSHDYSIGEEAQRYFDFGVMHAQIPRLLEVFGGAEGEGVAFVVDELRYLAGNNPWLIPPCILRNAAKYAAYRLGRIYRRLPLALVTRLSMTKVYWQTESST